MQIMDPYYWVFSLKFNKSAVESTSFLKYSRIKAHYFEPAEKPWFNLAFMPTLLMPVRLRVNIGVLGMFFNKIPPWWYFIAHEHGENTVGLGSTFNGYLA